MLAAAKRLEIRLRMAAPRFLRTLYRCANSLREHEPSRNLPPELIRDCRFFASREDMLDFLPRSGRVAEFGTLAGKFAREILRRNDPSELYLIDIDTSRIDLKDDDRVHIKRGLAHEIIAGFPDRYFDWIYIDADHSYAGTLRDAIAAMIEANRTIYRDPAKAVPAIMEATQKPREAVEYAIGIETKGCVLSVNSGFVRERTEWTHQNNIDIGDIPADKKLGFDQIADLKLAEEAVASLGGPVTIGECKD